MIEMKSLGENLDKAMDQALDYYVQLKKDEGTEIHPRM